MATGDERGGGLLQEELVAEPADGGQLCRCAEYGKYVTPRSGQQKKGSRWVPT